MLQPSEDQDSSDLENCQESERWASSANTEVDHSVYVTQIEDEKPEGKRDSAFLVSLYPDEDPKNFSLLHKWSIVLVVSTSALCATCTSSMVSVLTVDWLGHAHRLHKGCLR